MDKLYLVGYGAGSEELLTGKAKDVICKGDRILSTGRISQAIAHGKKAVTCTLPQLKETLKTTIEGVTVVLVSGDCSFFSVSKSIAHSFSSLYQIEMVNGISSIQYLSGKIAVAYDDAILCSMHGRDERIVPKVCYNKKVFALTGGGYKAHDICRMLADCGLANVKVCVGERLSYPEERVLWGTAEELAKEVFQDLAVIYIENGGSANPHLPIPDSGFIRGGVPMTKEEVRWLTIQKLAIEPTDTVFDIGAGTGSVSVEAARKAFDGFVYAIEVKEDACNLIRKNIEKHKAYNITVVHGEAPGELLGLPKPDKAFVGGSSGSIISIMEALVKLNPSVRIGANAVTLQSLGQILEGFKTIGVLAPDIICVNIAKSKKMGNYDMMMAQNPVYIVTGSLNEETEEERLGEIFE